MNKIKNCIPKRCELGGVEFTTKFVNDISNSNNYARILLPEGLVEIQNTVAGRVHSHSQIQNSYFHELAHGILDMGGYHELSDDEKLVQHIGNSIFEFLRSCDWIRIEELKHNNESEATFSFQTMQAPNKD